MSELATEGVAIFHSIFFEHFRVFQNKFHLFGGSYAAEFDAIFIPCTLVSHTTRAPRGVINSPDVARGHEVVIQWFLFQGIYLQI